MHLINFSSTRFDPATEPPNPINPIPGHAVLVWLAAELRAAGFESGEPDAEDWGWYINVSGADASYMVGASGEASDDAPPRINWVVQVHRPRSFFDSLLKRNQMGPQDALTAAVEAAIRKDPASRDVVVER